MIKKFINFLKNNLVLILLIIVPLLAGFNLLKAGYFPMHDDVQIMRLYEMEKCLRDGQIPCRWVPDMGAEFGHPLFNYHPVFAYYLGMVFRLFGFSFVVTSKLLFFTSLLLSSLFMYLLAKEFLGKVGGVMAASIYVLAPYHAVDIYVRGALTESWAIVFFPLIFWGIYKLIKTEEDNYFILLIFSFFLLFISHNTMPLLFIPLAMLWGLYWMLLYRKLKLLPKLLLAFVWGMALSAFFLLPSLLEIKLAKLDIMTTGYYDFRNHFVTIRQLLFDRSWGYGPSIPGPGDTMSFQLGWPLWPLTLLSGLLAVYCFFLKKEKNLKNHFLLFMSIIFIFSVFMTHAKSFFVWEKIPGFSFVQFPWRFLTLSIFTMSILIAGLVNFVKSTKKQILFGSVILVATLFLNLGYFKPEKIYSNIGDKEKLSGTEWRTQSMATLGDYVPTAVNKMPTDLAHQEPWVVEGEAKITEFQKRSDFWRFAVETPGDDPVVVEVPVFDFPVWDVFINTKKVQYASNPETGVIRVSVPAGNHTVVTGWFRNTPLRKVANGITLFSLGLFIAYMVLEDKRNATA